MKKSLWFSCIFIAILNTVSAQNIVTIRLNKNSKVKGQLLSLNENGNVILLVNNKDTVVIFKGSYQNMEITNDSDIVKKSMKNYLYGFSFYSLMNADHLGVGLKISGLKKVQKLGYAGINFGVDNYYIRPEENLYFVGGEYRQYVTGKNIATFLKIGSGYAIAFNNEDLNQVEAKGGWYLNPVLGFSFGKHQWVEFTLGYKFQDSSFVYQLNEQRSNVVKRTKRRWVFL